MPIWKHDITGNKDPITFFYDIDSSSKSRYINRLQSALDTAVREGILEETIFGRNEWSEFNIQQDSTLKDDSKRYDSSLEKSDSNNVGFDLPAKPSCCSSATKNASFISLALLKMTKP